MNTIKKFFLVERLSTPLVLPVLILGVFKYKTAYLTVTPLLKKMCILNALAHHFAVPVDISECPSLDTGIRFVDNRDLIPKAIKEILGDRNVLKIFSSLFFGIDDAEATVRSILHNKANRSFIIVSLFLMWLEATHPGPRRVWAYIYSDSFMNIFLKRLGKPAWNFAPPLWLVKGIRSARSSVYIIIQRLRSAFLQYSRSDSEIASSRLRGQNVDVLFFPHQSLFYGNLFRKDYFYSNDTKSSLHPSRILHVEIRNTPEINEKLLRQEKMGLPTKVMRPISLVFSLKNFLKCVYTIGRNYRLFNNVGSVKFSLFGPLVSSRIMYDHYYRELQGLSESAKIAIVGYDMLFPAELSLALKKRGVRTVGVQERMYGAFMGLFYSFVLDTYLVAGPTAKKALQGKPTLAVSSVEAVGLVRSDYLYDYKDCKINGLRLGNKKLVVALDYISNPDEDCQRLDFDVNWKANKVFYFDLINIAILYPQLHIVIRGKDIKWKELEYFKDIVRIIELLPNLEINQNYEEFNVSYKLCAKADLIIAKHTSLADECIAVGKQVIIHDYTHNANSIVSCMFDYGGSSFVCHDFNSVLDCVKRFLEYGYIIDKKEYDSIRGVVFDGLCDGRCRKRVRKIIKNILKECKSQ